VTDTGSAPPAWPVADPSAAETRPSWAGVAIDRGRRSIDVKVVIAVLIGLMSVTGAAVTWQASLLSERATDHDRLSIAETVEQQQLVAEAELLFANEKARAAEYIADLAAATSLDEQSAATDDTEVAGSLQVRADTLRAEADQLTRTGAAPVSFLAYLDDENELDEAGLRADLRAIQAGNRELDPERNATEARELRDDALRLVRFLLPIVAAIVLLTVAQVSRHRRVRLGLLGVATTVWLVVTGLAFAG
jgi:hypothetical protein